MSWNDEDIDALFRDSNAGKIPPFEDSFWEEMETMLPENGEGVDAVFVQAASSAQVPPYKEAYWKEMEAMLPGRKRRIAAYWWYSSAGVLVLLLSGVLFRNNHTAPAVPQRADRHSEITAEAKNQAGTGNMLLAERSGPLNSYSAALPENTVGSPVNPFPDNRREGGAGSDSASCGSGSSGKCGSLNDARLNVTDLPALITGVSYSMARAGTVVPPPDKKDPRFYVQISAGAGQSMLKTESNNLVQAYALGAGIFKDIDGVRWSFGVQGKADFVNNFSKQTTMSNGTVSDRHYKQFYSLETPLSASCLFGRNTVGVYFSPGLQLGYTGTYSTYQDDSESRVRVTGRMPYNRTLTMESGLTYARQLGNRFYIGASAGADLIRPLGDDSEYGENRLMPLNCSFFVRTTF